MQDFLQFGPGTAIPISPVEVLARLLAALVLGGIVAWVYRKTRAASEVSRTFPPTLVLLAVLIAMVTQVIGESVARAFSLVGALSIVRFRTVVRDTQDTAFVIFAVAVGMAAGASTLWVALIGLGVVALAAYLMKNRSAPPLDLVPLPFLIRVRVGLGTDMNGPVGATLDSFLTERRLQAIETAKQGISIDVTYEAQLRSPMSAEELVKELNRVEGVQDVRLERRAIEID